MKHLIAPLILLAIPGVARAQQAEVVEYYAQDAIGSIRIVWDATGAMLGRHDYSPFGRSLFPAPAMPREGFGSQETDDETNQAYFHARMLRAGLARFTRPDPVQDAIFEPERWNRYSYTQNAPLTRIDPSGRSDFQFLGCADGRCYASDSTGVGQVLTFVGSMGHGSDTMLGIDLDPFRTESGGTGVDGETTTTTPPADPPTTDPPRPNPNPPPGPPGAPPTPQPRPMPTRWQQFRFCTDYSLRQNVPKTVQQLGQNLRTSVVVGVPLGLAIGAVIASEPAGLPAAPVILMVSTGTTVSTFANVSVNFFAIRVSADIVGAVGVCAWDSF